jgi:hypothetical protein
MTKDELIKARDAFERILKNAFYGIDSGDHEIMNPENYQKEMSRCCDDRQSVLNALDAQIKACDVPKIEGLGEALDKEVLFNSMDQDVMNTIYKAARAYYKLMEDKQ